MPSRLEEISSLLETNSAPIDFDPETQDSGFSLIQENEDLLAKEHYEKVGPSKLRAQVGVDLSVKKTYKGKKVNRSELYSDNGSDFEAIVSEDGEMQLDSDGDSEEEDVESKEENSEETSETDSKVNSENEDSYSQQDVRKQLENLGQQEQNQIKKLSETAQGNVAKGRHVRNQLASFGPITGNLRWYSRLQDKDAKDTCNRKQASSV